MADIALEKGPGWRYQAGTLRYTGRQVLGLCLVLLFGDFCAMIFESIFGPFMPLYLKGLHATNTDIAMLTTTIAGLMNFVFLPNVSMWTDRTRTRWGRRIPFLFWATPVAVGSLILIAYAPDMAGAVHGAFIQGVSLTVVTLCLLAVFIMIWHFSNMIIINLFNFLLRDVIPLELMPQFLAFFKLVGGLGHIVFQWFFFQYMLDHPKALFLGLGLVFLASFLAICLYVKEGEYPPPEPAQKNLLKSYFLYFKESLSIPLYRNYFIAYGLNVLGSSATTSFLTLFARNSLGLSLEDMGHISAMSTAVSLILYVPFGYLCKRLNPLKVTLFALSSNAVIRACEFLFVHDHNSWLAYSVIAMIPSVAWILGSLSVSMILFPAKKFGQFSSGLNSMGYGSLVVTSACVGYFMDFAHNNYRLIFIVSFTAYALAIIPMILVYRGWKRHGGPDNYVPPLPDAQPDWKLT